VKSHYVCLCQEQKYVAYDKFFVVAVVVFIVSYNYESHEIIYLDLFNLLLFI
jgi:hypothetical protein